MTDQPQGKIFHLDESGHLSELDEAPFDLEDEFQALLADHPDLLPGDQIDPETPRRWLLVTREAAVATDSTTWALDHLFVDQDAIPTLVEVKRGSNPELRRKVVGQMLDYAASAPISWPAGTLRILYESRCQKQQLDPMEGLHAALGDDLVPEEYWARVDENLKSRRLRLLFVTDRMVPELRRVVEFLNQSMADVEVLAVEVRRYVGKGPSTLVPVVHGQTLAAEEKKAATWIPGPRWTEDRLLDELERKRGAEARTVAAALIAWAKQHADQFYWGRGRIDGSVYPEFLVGGGKIFPFGVWTYGQIEIQFKFLQSHPPYDRVEERESLRERLSEIFGVQIPPEKIDKQPNVPLMALSDPGRRSQFLAEISKLVERVRAQGGSA